MQPLMKKYGQRLGMQLPDELPLVWADPRRTGQVLVNLLSNAIKVGPAGSEITITVKVCGQEVQVFVSDQGPGIPPGQHKDIFSRFANTNISNDRVEHGAGLGLSVVKAVVEAQKGQVGVMDGAGGGAIFWFSVPISEGEV
jgi:signal transduction histidine kinase